MKTWTSFPSAHSLTHPLNHPLTTYSLTLFGFESPKPVGETLLAPASDVLCCDAMSLSMLRNKTGDLCCPMAPSLISFILISTRASIRSGDTESIQPALHRCGLHEVSVLDHGRLLEPDIDCPTFAVVNHEACRGSELCISSQSKANAPSLIKASIV
jgi:hypothetical protein